MFLNGNFVALPAFAKRYGVQTPSGDWSIQAKWQSALFQSGQCGAFVGVFLAGPVTTRLGYRWTTILALILMNATIFVSFFVSSSHILPLSHLVAVLFSDRPPHSGQLPRCPYSRTVPRGHPMGVLHCQLASLRQRDCPSCPSWSHHSHPADELVYRSNHCCRRHLRL